MVETDRFVNPYAFVPLPKKVLREEPTHHAGPADGLLCGTVDVAWTLRTPLLLPKTAKEEGWICPDGSVRIPGSSLKGSVRSLHEAMFNGCLRIVDQEFTPSYRMAAREGTEEGWRLAVVSESKAGTATEVRLCATGSELWVDATSLHGAWDGAAPPTSGDLIRLRGATTESSLGRLEMRSVDSVQLLDPDDLPRSARVVLVTSVQARHDYRKDPVRGRVKGRAFWVTAEVTDDHAPVSPAASARFMVACAGSDDRRRLEGSDSDQWAFGTAYDTVSWWTRSGNKGVVARRVLASGFLFEGNPVWVRLGIDGSVADVRLAQIWRVPGSQPMWKRFGTPREDPRTSDGRMWPTRLHACRYDESEGLCLTCSIFGAADTEGDTSEDRRARQRSYGAHVRFGSAVSAPVKLVNVPKLAPLGMPHPGAGMFYLQARELKRGRPLGDVATRWGISQQDNPVAPMAGRKFYWHSDPNAQAEHWRKALGRKVPPRYEASRRQSEGGDGETKQMVRAALLVPAGTILRGTVAFDRLTPVQLESLLAALDPATLLSRVVRSSVEYAVHLAGGKPFGLGSATVAVDVHAEEISRRYSSQRVPYRPLEAPPIDAFTARVGDLKLTEIAVMLDVHGLGADEKFVAYPPGGTWDTYRDPNDRDGKFEQSFEFFQWANGEVRQGGVQPWFPLAVPEWGTDQTLPIPPRKEKR